MHAKWLASVVLVATASSSCGSDGSQSAGGTPSADGEAWIVYQGAHGLNRVLPTGFNERSVLDTFGSNALHPDFSPDGRWLAFTVEDDDGTRDVWKSGWDGADPVLVYDCVAPCRDADDAAWSPDGKRLAFIRVDNVDGHNPGSALQMIDTASGDVTTVFRTEGAEYVWGPRWSPDGRSVVVGVARYIDDGNDTDEVTGNAVAVIHLDRTPATMDVLRPFEDFATYPDWHPTEDLIMFEMGGRDPFDATEPPQNVFTMRPDGSDLKQVTKQAEGDDSLWMATFRTDGEGILATRIARTNGDLSIVSIAMDGTVSDLTAGSGSSPRSGAHPRQRRPVG